MPTITYFEKFLNNDILRSWNWHSKIRKKQRCGKRESKRSWWIHLKSVLTERALGRCRRTPIRRTRVSQDESQDLKKGIFIELTVCCFRESHKTEVNSRSNIHCKFINQILEMKEKESILTELEETRSSVHYLNGFPKAHFFTKKPASSCTLIHLLLRSFL